jgi:SAM-dependent methyltransferase
MHERFIDYLVCPETKEPLTIKSVRESKGSFIKEGVLVNNRGDEYPIRGFIPRFTGDSYAYNFTLEWEKHPTILDELISSYSLYRKRFAEETKWEENLLGELVLEAGCGPGSLTPFPLERGATVISFDMSSSVEVTHKKIGLNENSLVLQASIFSMPFPAEKFDKCFCFGVLQHTPDPQKAFQELVTMLKPSGKISADSYIAPNPTGDSGHRILRAKYRFRKIIPNLTPKTLHFLVRQYVNILFPIAYVARSLPGEFGHAGLEFMKNLMIDDYCSRLVGMDVAKHKEFAVLDIFDFLSPMYDIPQTLEQFRDCFEKAGLTEIDVHLGYNGIEGRATKPLK